MTTEDLDEDVYDTEDTDDGAPLPLVRRPFLQQVWLWTVTIALIFVSAQVIGWIRAPSLPEYAPDFVLTDLEGEQVRLEDLRGQTVVLNFWATWCAPCRAEVGTFTRFAERNPEIAVIGIAADGPVEKLRAVKSSWGIGYTVVSGTPQVFKEYDIDAWPTTVVIGPDGRVASAHVGAMFRPQLTWATWVW